MTALLEVRGLRKRYGALWAVDGINLEVQRGEVVALLGPNGSGKTTLLRCVAGLLRPTAGSIAVDGSDLQRRPRAARRALRYLPQQACFPASLTVREIALFHARLRGLGADAACAATEEAGLSPFLDRTSGTLSGGMRQRLALALANLDQPPLMLLDEPTANLDPEGSLRFRGMVERWRQTGRGLLISTHVLADVEAWADRVLILVDGRPIAEYTIEQLCQQLDTAARLKVLIERPGPAHVAAAMAAGARHVELNCNAVFVSAAPEQRLEILMQLARLSHVRRFETEQPALEELYLRDVRARATGERRHEQE